MQRFIVTMMGVMGLNVNCLRVGFLGGILLAAQAWSYPTVLHFMPIAEILKHREIYLAHNAAGTERQIDKRILHSNTGVVGLFDRIEIGWVNDYGHETTLDAKVQIFDGAPGLANFALSAGFIGWRGREIDPYLVGRYDAGAYRLHAGWIRESHEHKLMLGLDADMPSGFTFLADFFSGSSSFTYLGFSYEVPSVEGLLLTAGFGIPARRSDGYQGYVNVGYGFKF